MNIGLATVIFGRQAFQIGIVFVVHVSPPHFVVAEVARLWVPTVTELWPVRLRTQTDASVHNRRHATAATTRAG